MAPEWLARAGDFAGPEARASVFKRLFWLAVGVGLGFGLSIWLARAIRRTADRYTPESVAGRIADGLRDFGKELREAIREGRAAMTDREAELRERLESRAPLASAMGRGADPAHN